MCAVSCGNNASSNHDDSDIVTNEVEVFTTEMEDVTAKIEEILVSAQQFNLGEVSFVTDSTWTISGNGITQIWSDAVTATGCNKTTFNGGAYLSNNAIYSLDSFLIDCRSNPNQKGDLFSWRAANELKDKLCPAPWRVPTVQDFIDLDIALGGTGENLSNLFFVEGKIQFSENHLNKYLNVWGGTFADWCSSLGWLGQNGGYWGHFWSQSDYSVRNGFSLTLGKGDDGGVFPRGENPKDNGYSLRCVRDN